MGRFAVAAPHVVVPASMCGVMQRALEAFAAEHRRNGGTIDEAWLELIDDIGRVAAWFRSRAVDRGADSGTDSASVGADAVASLVMSIQAAAARTGLSETAIRRACREGRLPASRSGRSWLIAQHDLDTYEATARKAKPGDHLDDCARVGATTPFTTERHDQRGRQTRRAG